MLNISLEEIKKGLNFKEFIEGKTSEIKGVSIDSRTLKKGDLFFALKGDYFDGHHYIHEAIQKGASGIVFTDKSQYIDSAAFGFRVSDSYLALQHLAQTYRHQFNLKVVGVTGSNGKTTTKDWIAELSSQMWKTHKTEGTLNNHLGVPLTLLDLETDHEVSVIEMGMSALGEIARLAQLARPNVGVVTCVNLAHLERLNSIENVYKAKLELVQSLDPQEGLAVLNSDDEWVYRMIEQTACRVVTFGTGKDADYRAKNIHYQNSDELVFDLFVKGEGDSGTVVLKTMGQHNVLNCLAALAVFHQLGGDLKCGVKHCSQLTLPEMRMQKNPEKGVLFINDAYNANPKSMEVALDTLEEIEAEGKKIFVCGDMMELGLYADEAHDELGEKIYNSEVDVLITYGHLARRTALRAMEFGMEQDNVFFCTEKKMIADLLQQVAVPGDVVLLKGSRRNQLEVILDNWRDKY